MVPIEAMKALQATIMGSLTQRKRKNRRVSPASLAAGLAAAGAGFGAVAVAARGASDAGFSGAFGVGSDMALRCIRCQRKADRSAGTDTFLLGGSGMSTTFAGLSEAKRVPAHLAGKSPPGCPAPSRK